MGRFISNNSDAVTVQGTVDTITRQGGRTPATPSISAAANVTSFTNHTLSGSSYFSYGSDTHSGSNWQLASDETFSAERLLVDYATKTYNTAVNLAVAGSIPREAGTYYARVRYISSGYESTAFSTPVAITVAASVSVSVTSISDSSYVITPTYSGAGSPSSYTYRISTTDDMSNVVGSGSFSSTVSINHSVTPDLLNGTTYYIELTTVGTNTVLTTSVSSLSVDFASLFSGSSLAVYNGTNIQFNDTVSSSVYTGSISYQFSTTNTFDTVAYTTSSTGAFAASSLPGLSDRSNSYFCRAVASINGTNVAASTPLSVGASFLYTSSTSTQTPAGYVGSAYIEAIGGGGAGGGAYSSAAGGSSGNFETTTVSITEQGSLSITIGQGGPGNGWSDPSSTYAGTTSVTVAGTTLSATGGRNATMDQQTRTYGQNTSKSAYGGAKGSSTGEAGETHPITNILGGNGGIADSYGGRGGNGYGAGGGGQTRESAYGGSGGGGGGGGGAFVNSRVGSSNGSAGNVGTGGSGANGAVRITYQDW